MIFLSRRVRPLLAFLVAIGLVACDMKVTSESKSETPPIENSKWSLSEDKDPITDAISRYAILPSNESDRLHLSLICSKTHGIDNLAFKSGEYSRFEVAEVIYRIDQAEPVEEPWFVKNTIYVRAVDGQEYIDALHDRLRGASILALRTKPMDPEDASVTLTFNIQGIEAARQYVLGAGACAKT